MKKNGRLFFILSLAAIAAAAILPYISNWSDAMIGDDWTNMVCAKHYDADVFLQSIRFSESDFLYRPVFLLYFRLNYLAWGLEPTGHHTVKGLFFAATCVLLFLLVLRLTGLRAAALVSGLVFALHPFNASCAIWISTHSNVLCVFFYLLTLLLFCEARRRKGIPLYAAFLVSMLFCFGSYELAYSLPLALLATEALLLRGKRELGHAESLPQKSLWHLPYLAVSGAFLIARFSMMQSGYHQPRAMEETLSKGVLGTIETVFLPISRIDLPAPLWPRLIPALAALALVILLFITKKNLRRPAIFGIVIMFAGLAPVLNIIHPALDMADTRLAIVSLAGFAVLLGIIVEMFSKNLTALIIAGLCAAILLGFYVRQDLRLSSRWSRTARWSDEIVTATTEACKDTPAPFRIVYLSYPFVHGLCNIDPSFILAAVIIQRPVQEKYANFIQTPYSDSCLLDQEFRREFFRNLPVRLDKAAQNPQPDLPNSETGYTIKREYLGKTFFFYWNHHNEKLVNCTDGMRKRLEKPRKSSLHKISIKSVIPISADTYRCDINNEQIYVTGESILKIPLDKTTARSFDQVDIHLSAATLNHKNEVFTANVSWQFEGEDEKKDAQKILKRRQPFYGFAHRFHDIRHYRVPLAQHLLDSGDKRIKSIIIFLPLRGAEYIIKDIRLIRFDD